MQGGRKILCNNKTIHEINLFWLQPSSNKDRDSFIFPARPRKVYNYDGSSEYEIITMIALLKEKSVNEYILPSQVYSIVYNH